MDAADYQLPGDHWTGPVSDLHGPLIFGLVPPPLIVVGVRVSDEGVAQGVATTLNFIGTGVVAGPVAGGIAPVRIDATPPPGSAQVTSVAFADTNSLVPVLLPSMALVAVAAGTYLVNFSGAFSASLVDERVSVQLRVAGVLQAASLRATERHRFDALGCIAIAGYRVVLAAPGDVEVFWNIGTAGVAACDGPRNLSIVQVS